MKPKADVTRSPKQGYQWPHKKRTDVHQIFRIKKKTAFVTSRPLLFWSSAFHLLLDILLKFWCEFFAFLSIML